MDHTTTTTTALKGLPALLALIMPAAMADIVMVGGASAVGALLSLYFDGEDMTVIRRFMMVILATFLGLFSSWALASHFFHQSTEAPWMVALALGFYFNYIPKLKPILWDLFSSKFNKKDEK